LHILLSTSKQRKFDKDDSNNPNKHTTNQSDDDGNGNFAKNNHGNDAGVNDNPITLLTVVREMLEGYPGALRMKDKRGNLPIALARESGTGEEIENLLSSFTSNG